MTLNKVKVGMIFKDQHVTIEIISAKEYKFEFMIIKGAEELMGRPLKISKVQLEEVLGDKSNVIFLGYKKDYPEYYL